MDFNELNELKHVKITRLITNQLIIGKTTEANGDITIESPYAAVPTQEGLQMFPFDAELIGKEIDVISVPVSSTIYSVEPSLELKNAYLKAISGLEIEPQKKLII